MTTQPGMDAREALNYLHENPEHGVCWLGPQPEDAATRAFRMDSDGDVLVHDAGNSWSRVLAFELTGRFYPMGRVLPEEPTP